MRICGNAALTAIKLSADSQTVCYGVDGEWLLGNYYTHGNANTQ